MRFALVVPLAAALAAPLHAGPPRVTDAGVFTIRHNDRAIGSETFSFERRSDSLVVTSRVIETPAGPAEPDTLEKFVTLTLRAADQDPLGYESLQMHRGQTLRRGLVFQDTSLVSYYQVDAQGMGSGLVRPPGRVFVMDPQVFVLYDVLCRSLHGRTFDRRPLTVLWLGVRDTIVEATAEDLGAETIRWGSRPVQARKLRVFDPDVEFLLWISPQGHMLRLSDPANRLLVERESPPVKRKRPPEG